LLAYIFLYCIYLVSGNEAPGKGVSSDNGCISFLLKPFQKLFKLN
jgi:hypothetical protein